MKIGFTAGTWDLLHPGHVILLEHAKQKCDMLIVGLHVNPSLERPDKNQPTETVFERYVRLMGALRDGDHVIPYETEGDLANLLAVYDIDIRFIGQDYEGHPSIITGYSLCKERNIELDYVSRYHGWSSSRLRERIKGR